MAKIDDKIRFNRSRYADTTGVSLDPKYTPNYSEEVVEIALALKANNHNRGKLSGLSDEFYLEYAKSLKLQDIQGRHNELYNNMMYNADVVDPAYAQYTYEEILEMAKNGAAIPDEVLQWAEAQQQTDVTSYVIITDNAEVEGDMTSEEIATNSDNTSLQKKAKEYTSKAEQAQKDTIEKVLEFEKVAKTANEIRKNKENTYENSMQEISKLTEEWKSLDNKSKNSTLTKSEKQRFKELGKLLNGKDGELTNEIQADSTELNNFLNSLDSLNEDIKSNLQLAQDTVNAGLDLSNLDTATNSKNKPHDNITGTGTSPDGPLSDPLFGVVGDSIALTAINTGRELESYTIGVEKDITTGDNPKIAAFSEDYTSLAEQTNENTKNTMGEAYETSSQDMDDADKAEKDAQKGNYDIELKFTSQNSIKAANTTIKASKEMVSVQKEDENIEVSLQKDLKNSDKEVKKLEKEAQKANQKHQSNLQQEELFLLELESLQQNSEVSTENDNNSETNEIQTVEENNQINNPQNSENQTKPTQTTEQNENKSTEIQEKTTQVEQVQEEDQKDLSQVSKTLNKTVTANSKQQNTAKKLDAKNKDLNISSDNLKTISAKTMIVGTGTVVRGVDDTISGINNLTTGISLMSNPFTYSAGVTLAVIGQLLIQKGILENVTGTHAFVTGGLGLATGEIGGTAAETITDKLKEQALKSKENNATIKQTQKDLGLSAQEQKSENTQDQTSSTNDTTETNIPANENQELIDSEQANQAVQTNETQETITPTNINNIETNEVLSQQKPEVELQATDTTTNTTETTTSTNTTETTSSTGTTASTETTETTNSTDTTSTTDDTNTTEESQAEENSKKEETLTVDKGFGYSFAIKATQTTQKAMDLTGENQENVEEEQEQLTQQTKQITTVAKKLQKTADVAEENQENTLSQIHTLEGQAQDANVTVQQATTDGDNEVALNAQNNAENISNQISTLSTTSDNTNATLSKDMTKGVAQISSLKEATKDLNVDTTELGNINADLRTISQDTIGVGVGTTVLGGVKMINAISQITQGVALCANPFTQPIGIAMIATGLILQEIATLDTTTGIVATATGVVGLTQSDDTEETANEAEQTSKDGTTEATKADKEVSEINNDSTDSTEETTEEIQEIVSSSEVNNSNGNIQREEAQELETDDFLTAAAVANNANISDSIATDEKLDRKLTKFNTESIIESKKKLRKVNAISSAYKGK